MTKRIIASVVLVSLVQPGLDAGDWPMYRSDATRSGYTPDPLPVNLSPRWTWTPRHAPAPAWPRDERMQFDRAFHVVIADGTVYFGSSADGRVHALDAVTGGPKWTFLTDAPIRFAPAVWRDRIFVASDDGYLYALSAIDGTLLQKWRGGPGDDKVLGNGRMVSRWPARGGPVVFDDAVYYAAGIWQSDGVFIDAIDAESGKILWTNDKSGGIYMRQPHGSAYARSGVSAQGYLLADRDSLFVPTGRAVPAAFTRSDGNLKYYHLKENTRGGVPTMTAGPFLYNGGYAFETETGNLRESAWAVDPVTRRQLEAGAIAAFPDGVIHANSTQLRALRWIEKQGTDRKGNPISWPDHEQLWSLDGVAGGTSLIVAGDTIVSTGGTTVNAVDFHEKKIVWSTEVDGTARGLAAADGRLYVSTERGTIHCFGQQPSSSPGVMPPETQESPYGENEIYAKAAEEIIEKSGITEGYCIDLGCGDGALAFELARRTGLHIYGIDPDPKNVAAARRKLDAAGLYGVRVTVHRGDPAQTSYPKYFANLAVSGRSVTAGADNVDATELFRLQRPYGGVACIGQPGRMKRSTRGAPAHAGSWTHQYSNPANTLCSADEVKGPLSVLWYRDIDLEVPQRHGRGPSPLFDNGRLFAEGLDGLIAVDAYNGHPLWRFELKHILQAYNADHIMGTTGTGSNYCLAENSVYIRHKDRCYRLDAATGRKLGEFHAPPREDGKPSRWGYIACEGGVLFGSVANEKHVVRHSFLRADEKMKYLLTESVSLFAMDAVTGELLWRYDAGESIRHNAIAIGDGRVFLIDRKLALDDLLSRAPARRGAKSEHPPEEHPPGELVVLDARTGECLWSSRDEIFGTMLAYSGEFDLLLMCYQSTWFKLPSELGGRMAVFRATDGSRVWDKKVNYQTRPLINDRTIVAYGGKPATWEHANVVAWDLLTGEHRWFDLQKSYGCGQLSGSKYLLLFRSATLGYFDLSREAGVENFGGIRPGCWINALAAGGLVLVPDASAGCQCSYQNRSWVALQGSE